MRSAAGPASFLPSGRGPRYGPAVPPTRFLAETSLEFVASRMRFLGYDVLTLKGARLEEALEAARREARTVLTLSLRRPRRFADVPVITVGRGDPAATVRELAEGHEPAGAPFSRCTECNTALQRRHPFEASGEVPGRVLRAGKDLSYCPTCGKWYWEGSHVAHVREWLERALGHPLAPPGPPRG